jgi:hypothetical protein
MRNRIAFVFALIGVAVLATLAPASAKVINGDITRVFGNVSVPPDEEVKGDVTVVFGDADIAGRVDGDVTVFGGTLTKEPGSVIAGSDTNVGSSNISEYVPFAPSMSSRIAHEEGRLMAWLAYSAIVLVAFLIFPVRVRTALDRIEHHPGLSAGIGVLTLVAVFPVAFLLAITIVGLPLIPVEFLALFALILIGHAALSTLIGRRLYEMILPRTTPSPLAALILGLLVVSAAGIVPVLGPLVMGLVWLVGLGAAVLAFVRETHFMATPAHVPAGAASGPRPPIGGPPMTTA